MFFGNYINSELRIPIGPKKSNLSGFVFLSIGYSFDRFASKKDKEVIYNLVERTKSNK